MNIPGGSNPAWAQLSSEKFDKDPGRWLPMFYGVKISVPVIAGGRAEGSITIYNQPFVMRRVTHKIVGSTGDPATSGLYQDNQYDISWRDDNRVFQNDEIGADLMFGSAGQIAGGPAVLDLPYPIPYAGNKTITFTVINSYTRVLTPTSDTFVVGICVSGVSNHGDLRKG